MNHDPSGYWGFEIPTTPGDYFDLIFEDIENVWNGAVNKVEGWLDETPKNKYTIPSSNDVLNKGNSYIGFIHGSVRPEKTKSPKATKAIKKFSSALNIVTFFQNTSNTWTANNNNTNRQRLQKMGIQTASFAGNYAVGFVGGVIAASGAGSGPGFGVTFVAGLLVVDYGSGKIEEWENKMYDRYNIE